MRVKILNSDEIHGGFQYTEGWNEDPRGLHYTDDKNALSWIHLGDHFREVLDAENEERIDSSKFRATRIRLGPRRPLVLLMGPTIRLNALCEDTSLIAHIADPSILELLAVAERTPTPTPTVAERTPTPTPTVAERTPTPTVAKFIDEVPVGYLDVSRFYKY